MEEKTLTLTESECNELLAELGEIPSKWSYTLIAKIKYNFEQQNKEEPAKA